MPAIATPPPVPAPTTQTPTPNAAEAAKAARAEADSARRGVVAGWISGLGAAVDDPAAPGSSDAPPPEAQSTPSEPNSSTNGTVSVPTAPATVKDKSQEISGASPATTPTPPEATPGAAKAADGAPPADPDKWPRSAKEWDQFKAIRNENYRKRDERIAALEKELKTRNERLAGFANVVDPKEHSAVREERDKLSEALRLAAVEKHPRFVAYYDGKVNGQIEMAKRVVGGERAEAVAALLKLPDSDYRNAKIEELIGDLTPIASTRLGSIINAVDELRAEREGEVARAREDFEKLTAKQQADQLAAQTAAKTNAERIFADTLKAAQSQGTGLPMLQPRADDAAWNGAVEQRIAAAKAILFGSEKPDELVRAALAAVSFPALLEAHSALTTENDQLKAQIAALRAATPAPSRGSAISPDGQPRPPSALKPGSRPMQAAAEWIGLLNQEPAQP